MNLGQTIRTGVTWLLAASTGGQILHFLFGIALARLLVPADFGMIVTISVFTGFVGMLASAGMAQSLIRSKEASMDDFNAVFTLQLALGIFIYLGFFVSAPFLAAYLENSLYADLLRVSAVSFLLKPFAFVRNAWLTRHMQFKKRALVELTTGALTGTSSIAMAAAGMGVWSLILAGLIGAFVGNSLLSLATPLRPRLYFRISIARKHGDYGLKITINDFLKYVTEQSINLILSKMAGPSFLGLFNKAESLARAPNRLIMPPTGQTVFRAMSKVQEDLDQTKYLLYRTITLLMVYISPLLVILWYVAEPFIGVLYGDKWLPAAEPLRIMLALGIVRIVGTPCGVLLAAQNRLMQEMARQMFGLLVVIPACFVGLKWGLAGIAWAMVLSGTLLAVYAYVLVCRTIPTRLTDLVTSVTPAVILNTPLVLILAAVHLSLAEIKISNPAIYLLAMVVCGSLTYAVAFFYLPVPTLRSEALRWRQRIRTSWQLVHSHTLAP